MGNHCVCEKTLFLVRQRKNFIHLQFNYGCSGLHMIIPIYQCTEIIHRNASISSQALFLIEKVAHRIWILDKFGPDLLTDNNWF